MDMQPSSSSDGRTCLVCGAEAHGIHFQVNSCRACAAFFRRSTDIGKKYKCRRAKNDCDVSKDIVHQCRRCRYEKCKKVGMTLNAVLVKQHQMAIQASLSTNPSSQLSSNIVFHDSPETDDFYLQDMPEIVFEDHRLKMETDGLITSIKEVLNDTSPSKPLPNLLGVKLTPMQSLLRAFNDMIPGGRPEKIAIYKTIDLRFWMKTFGDLMKRLAKWAMGCEEFAQLPLDDRWRIYLNFWPHMYFIERCARSLEYLGLDVQPLHLISDNVAVNLLDFEYTVPNMPEERRTKLRDMFRVHDEMMYQYFIKPMTNLNMTTYEVVYLCTQTLWSISKVKGLSEQTYDLASRILDQSGNELHNYYAHELRLENYASRLAKIVKLLSESENLFRHRKDIMLTADVFGIFGSDLHESELCAHGSL
ncbi:hypothetical protein L596_011935 [Steinernema carpocapsae]|uniref:Nuclear receptor domain-containing protein n=1 Tax=Steinernema carpocapsae TaxID=34508 RepID=A0A4U5NVL1_STECR|nr:hypothetical protein L596_011935 [Steinernema carpocapsae]